MTIDAPVEPAKVAANDAPALSLSGVSVRFGGIKALTDVSLTVPEAGIHGLIGPNGAGKTTLFDVISGLRVPNSGRIALGTTDITRASATRRARLGLRRTFQRVQLFGRLSVADNLLVALEHHGGGGGLIGDVLALPGRRRREHERRERVAEVAELCGLTAVLDRPAGSLSVALARQVELGRALVDQPTVLLLDEPTSGLDDEETARLGRLITGVSDDHRCAIVLVEHNVQFVMDHCRYISFLNLGRVLATGTPGEVRANPEVQQAYLGEVQPAPTDSAPYKATPSGSTTSLTTQASTESRPND
jgi:branched-chain amino acid transport system ATP-binding protein